MVPDSRRLMVFFLLVFAAIVALRQEIEDFDLWWHLAQGRWILEHGRVPWEDPFSYMAEGRPWIAYSWLAEVLFHGLASGVGFGSLIILQAALATALTGVLYLACRAAGARATVAVATAALAAIGTSFAWGLRPVLFTLVFLAVMVWAVRSPRGERHVVWIAPLVTALWANVHVLFVWGIGLVGFSAFCRSLEAGARAARPLWIATGLSAVASLATPYGPWMVAEVARMAAQPGIAPEVTEFQSPSFTSPVGLAMSAFFFPAVVVLASSSRRPSLFELGTFFGPLAFGLLLQRNMALFAILAAPTIARSLEELLPPEGPAPPPPPPRLAAAHGVLLAAGLLWVAAEAPSPSAGWRESIVSGRFPVAAVDLLEASPPERLFNDFDWGGFVLWRLFPGVRVSIDGRTQVYGEELLRPYMRTHFLEPGWEGYLEAAHPDVILWPAGDSLAELLRERPEWRVELEDETAVVLRRR